MPRLSLQWPYDRDGYRIEKEKRTGAKLVGEKIVMSARVVRNGGRMIEGVDLCQVPLYAQMADIKDETSLLEFVNKWGLFRNRDSESVDLMLEAARTMRVLVEMKRKKDWLGLKGWFASARIKHTFVVPGEPMDGYFQPATLWDAALMRLFFDVVGGLEIRRCARAGCLNHFYVGRSVGGMRRTAQFCGPTCQKKHAYETRRKKVRKRK